MFDRTELLRFFFTGTSGFDARSVNVELLMIIMEIEHTCRDVMILSFFKSGIEGQSRIRYSGLGGSNIGKYGIVYWDWWRVVA